MNLLLLDPYHESAASFGRRTVIRSDLMGICSDLQMGILRFLIDSSINPQRAVCKAKTFEMFKLNLTEFRA